VSNGIELAGLLGESVLCICTNGYYRFRNEHGKYLVEERPTLYLFAGTVTPVRKRQARFMRVQGKHVPEEDWLAYLAERRPDDAGGEFRHRTGFCRMLDASRSEFLSMMQETRIIGHREPSAPSTASPELQPDPYRSRSEVDRSRQHCLQIAPPDRGRPMQIVLRANIRVGIEDVVKAKGGQFSDERLSAIVRRAHVGGM
jgi:hypothetical protein